MQHLNNDTIPSRKWTFNYYKRFLKVKIWIRSRTRSNILPSVLIGSKSLQYKSKTRILVILSWYLGALGGPPGGLEGDKQLLDLCMSWAGIYKSVCPVVCSMSTNILTDISDGSFINLSVYRSVHHLSVCVSLWTVVTHVPVLVC